MNDARPIVIAGAGIAGLTAAIAFATRGFSVEIFERAPELTEIGAGIQLSPNATRILDRLGVLPRLSPSSVRPGAVVLQRASDLGEIARIPLAETAERRWGAPYLTAHRADLQAALLARVGELSKVRLTKDSAVESVSYRTEGISVMPNGDSARKRETGFVVAADGVWSALRKTIRADAGSQFAGQIAWRATLPVNHAALAALAPAGRAENVTAILDGGFHLVAYPVRAGAEVNLAAFTRGRDQNHHWSAGEDAAELRKKLRATDRRLAPLSAAEVKWTSYPVHTVDAGGAWTDPRGLALIGDAAHAMTPFAAQGAAMAIEDAETLAQIFVGGRAPPTALSAWQAARRERVARVARRGALNHFAWSAFGPVALARDLALRLRPPEAFAADLDWLYGWSPTE
jgi:salicylate hydroxylase